MPLMVSLLKLFAEANMETERLCIHTATREKMEKFIASQGNDILIAAYNEMLDSCIKHLNQ